MYAPTEVRVFKKKKKKKKNEKWKKKKEKESQHCVPWGFCFCCLGWVGKSKAILFRN